MWISLLLIVPNVQLNHLIFGVINLSRNSVVKCGGISSEDA